MTTQSKLMTIKEASSLLGVTPLTLRNWDRKGKLTALRHPLNNYRVYRREDIEKLVEEISTNVNPVDNRRKKQTKKLAVQHIRE